MPLGLAGLHWGGFAVTGISKILHFQKGRAGFNICPRKFLYIREWYGSRSPVELYKCIFTDCSKHCCARTCACSCVHVRSHVRCPLSYQSRAGAVSNDKKQKSFVISESSGCCLKWKEAKIWNPSWQLTSPHSTPHSSFWEVQKILL